MLICYTLLASPFLLEREDVELREGGDHIYLINIECGGVKGRGYIWVYFFAFICLY